MTTVEQQMSCLQKQLEEERELRQELSKVANTLTTTSKEIVKLLQVIHSTIDKDKVSSALKECKTLISEKVNPAFKELESLVCPNPEEYAPYFKYQDLWFKTTQKMVFVVAMIQFLEDGSCAVYEDVAKQLNLATGNSKGITLDIEDFLMGLLMMASELARLAVNCVTLGDYDRPRQIFTFVSELSAGFQMLTFKNDFLRRRYDVLKYDVNKIEEIVYDLSIREMGSKPT